MRLFASTGILGLALAMAPIGLDLSLDTLKIGPVQALAKSGSGSDGDGGSDSSGSGSGGDGGSDSSGSGSDGDGGSDNSGSGSDGDDDNHDNSGSGSTNSGPGSANSGRHHGGQANTGGGDDGQRAVRPEIALDLAADDLNDVMAGRKVLVDDLGRVLEVEIELEHGFRTVTAKPHGGDSQRNPGPITSFDLVDAGGATTAPDDDDGTPDQGPGDN
jgi:hypothetical protein